MTARQKQLREEAFRQTINKIKAYPIIEYAAVIGFQPVRRGNYFSLKEHDSVIIKPNENTYFRNSTKKGGTIIDFSMEFEGKNQKEAIKDLIAYVGEAVPNTYTVQSFTPIKKEKNTSFTLPPADTTNKNVYAYLINSRKIDKSIVDLMLQTKHLYQDEHKNCVFVSYDKNGQAEFASKRGTNTFKRFVADVAGSNYKHCFYINNHAQTMVITESVIDSMSVMTVMQRKGRALNRYNFLSLNGVSKFSAVRNHLTENPEINSIVLAVDNDAGGLSAIEHIKEDLAEMGWQGKTIEYLPKHTKDWNAELQYQEEQTNSDMQIKEQTEDVDVEV
ncbi:MAG: DUF3991 and toprim domain-containing protein [Ruminococcus sp.]|nr:DUF3991 and toprim domain-containing protein [Ruminococcus sp.]